MSRITHISCGTMHPVVSHLEGVNHCLVVESDAGLILVDTGYGLDDYIDPSPPTRLFLALTGVAQDPAETAIRQVMDLGYDPADVRHIVLTHLHLDHAGGLPDFPDARVHVMRSEIAGPVRAPIWMRWAFDARHLAHGPAWVLHGPPTETWFGFEACPILAGLDPVLFFIPLPGHTPGHAGVAVETDTGWLFHVGDAASRHHPSTDIYQRPGEDYGISPLPHGFARDFAGNHIARLRALYREHGDEVTLFSSHDPVSYRELALGGGDTLGAGDAAGGAATQ